MLPVPNLLSFAIMRASSSCRTWGKNLGVPMAVFSSKKEGEEVEHRDQPDPINRVKPTKGEKHNLGDRSRQMEQTLSLLQKEQNSGAPQL